jgi:hypothetical protein
MIEYLLSKIIEIQHDIITPKSQHDMLDALRAQ